MWRGVTIMGGCVVLAVAGCGSVHVTAPPGTATASAVASRPASPASATPRQRAVADAAAILASFAVPPGARRLSGAPEGVLKHPPMAPGTPDLVDAASWWQAPGTPQAVLSWERAHLPRRLAAAGNSALYRPGTTAAWSDSFSLPAVPGVLDSRQLLVEVVSSGSGQTAVRVDAQVTWLPAKPAIERIPSAARMVTITAIPGLDVTGRTPAPVTITSAAAVRRIASLIDGLPVSPPGTYSCPMDTGRALRMTFRTTAGGPVLAVAAADLDGCGGVDLTVGGATQPGLSDGSSLAQQVLAIAGLHWPGYAAGGSPSAVQIRP
jgi:hypothetical protein